MQVELYVTAGPAKGKHFVFDKPDSFLFGRAADAHISLPQDRYVSRQHFLLEISPPRCKLRDLNSKNGVLVNGVLYGGQAAPNNAVTPAFTRKKEVLLQHGDEIVVGDTHIKILIRTTPPPKSAGPLTVQPPQTMLTCRLCGQAFQQYDARATQHSEAPMCPACREKHHREELRDMLKTASDQQAQRPVEPGRQTNLNIPGYQLGQKIVHSGSGMMYRGTQLASGDAVVIKLLSPHGDIDPYLKRAFQRELTIIQQLKHPNLVRFLEHGEAAGNVYCVFEYVDGYSLPQYLSSQGGRLPLAEAAPLWLGILDGLAYAHRVQLTLKDPQGQQKTMRGIVHRNLKPQNILLARQTGGWLPKITDFGLAKSFESAGFTDITVPGDVLGTPVYWPREQITHYRFLNPASDVFAIAAVFYEMVTGSWVRDGFEALFKKCKQLGRLPSISDYMLLIANHPAIPIRDREPAIPEPVARVLDRALQEEELPHDVEYMRVRLQTLRYPDAGAFRQALVQAFQALGLAGGLNAWVPSNGQITANQDNSATLSASGARPSGQIILPSASPISARQQVALLLLDIVGSTQLIINTGDTNFSTIMGTLLRRVRKHPSAAQLMSLRSTGDGFLAVFKSVNAAFAVARTYLEQPLRPNVHVRIALHWGMVNLGPDGDILGTEVRRVFRVENIQKDQCLVPTTDIDRNLATTDRILATQAVIDQLAESEKPQFQKIGTFALNRAGDVCCDLWAWHHPQ